MPRISRAIAVGYPHHITQRGNYRQAVFAEAGDYSHYLHWLAQSAARCGLEIWAYCLMPNHVHLVGVPMQADSLSQTFRTVHMQYARYFNGKRNAVGHLWQGRFFSCAMDEDHVSAAVRYVELNPVRSGLVESPHDYPWSSAKSHVSGVMDPVLSGRCFLTETVSDWRQYLGMDRDSEAEAALVKATITGRPCGQAGFIRKMEQHLGRKLTFLPRGRPHGRKNKSK
jgi:putative transposase